MEMGAVGQPSVRLEIPVVLAFPCHSLPGDGSGSALPLSLSHLPHRLSATQPLLVLHPTHLALSHTLHRTPPPPPSPPPLLPPPLPSPPHPPPGSRTATGHQVKGSSLRAPAASLLAARCCSPARSAVPTRYSLVDHQHGGYCPGAHRAMAQPCTDRRGQTGQARPAVLEHPFPRCHRIPATAATGALPAVPRLLDKLIGLQGKSATRTALP